MEGQTGLERDVHIIVLVVGSRLCGRCGTAPATFARLRRLAGGLGTILACIVTRSLATLTATQYLHLVGHDFGTVPIRAGFLVLPFARFQTALDVVSCSRFGRAGSYGRINCLAISGGAYCKTVAVTVVPGFDSTIPIR